jgi:hypothetical protein
MAARTESREKIHEVERANLMQGRAGGSRARVARP